jgi:hypothetical protein
MRMSRGAKRVCDAKTRDAGFTFGDRLTDDDANEARYRRWPIIAVRVDSTFNT